MRNFFYGSKSQQARVRKSYKPQELHKRIRMAKLTEEVIPFSEAEFRMKVRESKNRIEMMEKGGKANDQ